MPKPDRSMQAFEDAIAMLRQMKIAYPDLRLCQMIGNLGETYHLEDRDLTQRLKDDLRLGKVIAGD